MVCIKTPIFIFLFCVNYSLSFNNSLFIDTTQWMTTEDGSPSFAYQDYNLCRSDFHVPTMEELTTNISLILNNTLHDYNLRPPNCNG